MDMRMTVITPSIRPEYLHITQECLEKQTFQDFEWLTECGLRNRGFTLPSDFNKMLLRARGERIVILQDCITIEPDVLERIDKLPNDPFTFVVNHEGKYDWRKHKATLEKKEDGIAQIDAHYWEIDFGCAPPSMFFDVGGFDEEFNKGWSWENVEIAFRAEACGYKFYCHSGIEGYAIDHDKIREHPFRKTREPNSWRANETRERARRGDFKVNYLPSIGTQKGGLL